MSGERTEVVDIQDEDASFILGTGGRTKKKLCRVCQAELNIREKNGSTVLEIRGTSPAIERAKRYVDYVRQQRVGPVELGCTPEERDDLTCIPVPHDCVGYVTGRKGQGLRFIEEEWDTLMFFTNLQPQQQRSSESSPPKEFENLAIFGVDRRRRRGAELKVMSAVEQKLPGYYTKDVTSEVVGPDPEFDTDMVPIADDDYSYALGKEGSTRKKLARASGAVLEYVGRVAFIAGTAEQRKNAKDYLRWLCAQRVRPVHVEDVDRPDCSWMPVPLDCVAYVTGKGGSALRRVEEQTGTFIFLDSGRCPTEPDKERLLVFGESPSARNRAIELVERRIQDKLTGRTTPIIMGGYGRFDSRRRRTSNSSAGGGGHRRRANYRRSSRERSRSPWGRRSSYYNNSDDRDNNNRHHRDHHRRRYSSGGRDTNTNNDVDYYSYDEDHHRRRYENSSRYAPTSDNRYLHHRRSPRHRSRSSRRYESPHRRR